MPYELEISDDVDKIFAKMAKRDKSTLAAIDKKVSEILLNPHHFKPLRAPMQNLRRVHIGGCFVLVYEIDEGRKVVKLIEFEHHDNAY